MRNMKRTEEQGKAFVEERKGLDLRQSEIKQLLDIYEEAGGRNDSLTPAFYAISSAYYCGIAVGRRNA